MLNLKQIVKGKCIDLSFEGKGVVRINNDMVFCDGLFIGEEADIEITYKRAGYYFGKIKKLYSTSSDRIQPLCKICTACGGCQFQQLSYKAQLEFKRLRVERAFKKAFPKLNINVNDVIGMDDSPYYYRNKIQVPFQNERKGKVVYGFFKEYSHKIVPFDKCYIQDERTHTILKNIAKLMEDFKIPAYDEDSRTGIVRHVLIKTSSINNDVMVVFVVSKSDFPSQRNFINALVKLNPEIKSIVLNINSRSTNVILGEREKVLYGKGFIIDDLLGVKFKVSSSSFFQVNHEQCEKLYKCALDGLELSKDDVLLDAYSGVGTIGLIASKNVKKVLSVEINPSSHRDAKNNAINNGITNVDFILGDSKDIILSKDEKYDAIVIDPPRKGCDKAFLDTLNASGCKKISYISCNPDSLVEDLKTLTKQYNIVSIQPVDMFPFTAHVETVVCLYLKHRK